jgi:hypothetical protein
LPPCSRDWRDTRSLGSGGGAPQLLRNDALWDRLRAVEQGVEADEAEHNGASQLNSSVRWARGGARRQRHPERARLSGRVSTAPFGGHVAALLTTHPTGQRKGGGHAWRSAVCPAVLGIGGLTRPCASSPSSLLRRRARQGWRSSTIPVVGGWTNGVAGTRLGRTAVGNARDATERGDAADEARLEAHGPL